LSQLTLYSQFNMRKPFLVSSDIEDVAGHLIADGVRLEQWQLRLPGQGRSMSKDLILNLYQQEIVQIKSELGFQCADFMSVGRKNSNLISLRSRFLSEHTHSEDEVRFFISGTVLVYLHIDQRIYIVQCGAGDFLVIKKGIKHWFDMGPEPVFSCIRWYGSEEGLKNQYTGSYVAESTPRWESILGAPL